MRSIPILASVLALVLTTEAVGQETAEQTAERYFAAMKAGQWTTAAEMMHPAALGDFRRLVEQARRAAQRPDDLEADFGVAAAELDSLSDVALFARIIERQMTRDDEVSDAMREAEYKQTAVVTAGDTTHVDYQLRLKLQDQWVETPSRVSLLRDGPVWRVLLAGKPEEKAGPGDPER